MKSGVEAVKIVTENFIGKILNKKFFSLGFSLFFFSISLITSATGCVMTITYARRKDVQMSWSEEIRIARDLWLGQHWKTLCQRKKQ